MRVTHVEHRVVVNGQGVTVQRRFRKTVATQPRGLTFCIHPPGGTMGKERQRETILKTDQRNLYPELGLQGNSPAKLQCQRS